MSSSSFAATAFQQVLVTLGSAATATTSPSNWDSFNSSTTTTTGAVGGPSSLSNETLTSMYWMGNRMEQRSYCAIGGATASLAACLFACVYFCVKRKEERVRSAVNECLFASFILGVFSSINIIVASALRLNDPMSMQRYCDVSGIAVQLFVISAVICEGGFFATILNELRNGGINDFDFPRRVIGGSVIFGVVTSVISMAILPVDPLWGTRYSPVGEPWCWLPDTDTLNHTAQEFIIMKILFGYGIFVVAAIIAVYSLVNLTRVMSRVLYHESRVVVPLSVKLRLLYFVSFIAIWTLCGIHRFASDPVGFLGRAQAVLEPLLPFLNVLTFAFADGPLRDVCVTRRKRTRFQLPDTKAQHDATLLRTSKNREAGAVGDNSVVVDDDDSGAEGGSGGFDGVSSFGFERQATTSQLSIQGVVQAVHKAAEEEKNIIARLYFDHDAQEFVVVRMEGDGRDDDAAEDAEFGRADGGGGGSVADRLGASFVVANNPSFRHLGGNLIADPKNMTVEFKVPQLEKPLLAVVLSLLAGYCDVCGFITLDLFTAHITGNFATIGMSVVKKSDDVWIKVAGVVVFCAVISLAQFTSTIATAKGVSAPRVFLVSQASLLLASCVFYSAYGPFKRDGKVMETAGAYATGLSMVAAMAIQNAFQRLYLVGLPMTTLMTGNATGFFIDIFSWRQPAARLRLKNSALAIVSFVIGCGTVTAIAFYAPKVVYIVPPIVSLTALVLGWRQLGPPPAPSK